MKESIFLIQIAESNQVPYLLCPSASVFLCSSPKTQLREYHHFLALEEMIYNSISAASVFSLNSAYRSHIYFLSLKVEWTQ